jgi:hypothetical protein
MKALAGTVGKILFWIFAVAIFFWTASLSLAALRTILPNDPIKPYIGLVLTDIGALTWLLVFIGQAQGLPQRAISLIMFIIDLSGVVLLAAFELLSSGQTLTGIPPEMGTAVIWGVIALTLVNLTAAYFYHLAEPNTWKGIEFGVLTDRLQKEALQQAQMNVEKEAQSLGAILAARATAELKYNLRLPMSDFEQSEHTRSDIPASKQIIDGQVSPAPSISLPFWKRHKKPAPVNMAAAANVVTYPQEVPQVVTKCVSCDRPTDGTLLCSICVNSGIKLDINGNPYRPSPQPQVKQEDEKPGVWISDPAEFQKILAEHPNHVPGTFTPKPTENPPAGDAPFPGKPKA